MNQKSKNQTAHARGLKAARSTLAAVTKFAPNAATKMAPIARVVLTGLGYAALIGGAAGCFELPAWGPPAPPKMPSENAHIPRYSNKEVA